MDLKGISNIQNKIIEDAENYAKDLLKSAYDEAFQIIEDANKEASAKRDAILENASLIAEQKRLKIQADFELEKRKQILSRKQELIQECYDKALEKLLHLTEDEYINLLSGIVMKNIDDSSEIILSEADRVKIGEKLLNKCIELMKQKSVNCSLTLSDECRKINGGLILRSGNIEKNYSFEFLLKIVRDETQADIVKILFADK